MANDQQHIFTHLEKLGYIRTSDSTPTFTPPINRKENKPMAKKSTSQVIDRLTGFGYKKHSDSGSSFMMARTDEFGTSTRYIVSPTPKKPGKFQVRMDRKYKKESQFRHQTTWDLQDFPI